MIIGVSILSRNWSQSPKGYWLKRKQKADKPCVEIGLLIYNNIKFYQYATHKMRLEKISIIKVIEMTNIFFF